MEWLILPQVAWKILEKIALDSEFHLTLGTSLLIPKILKKNIFLPKSGISQHKSFLRIPETGKFMPRSEFDHHKSEFRKEDLYITESGTSSNQTVISRIEFIISLTEYPIFSKRHRFHLQFGMPLVCRTDFAIRIQTRRTYRWSLPLSLILHLLTLNLCYNSNSSLFFYFFVI